MSDEPTETPQDAAPDAAESPQGAESQPVGETPPELAASREAAKYRTRLRAAEAELETRDAAIGAMREEVERLHRREVERSAAGAPYWLKAPGDVWLVADLGDMLDDDGRLSDERVKDALGRVAKERPDWTRRPDLGQGVRGGGVPAQREASFGELVKRRGTMSR